MKFVKKHALWATAGLLTFGAAGAEEVKIGVALGYTGPIESLAPAMADSAELALKEVSDSGMLLDGMTLVPVRADTFCIDPAGATTAVERLVNDEGIAAMVGAACSGVTTAVVNAVGAPNGVVMISPSATSPALSTIEDKGYFFRTAPSDARQGQLLAEIVTGRGVNEVALTYTNNDYGKGLQEAFSMAFEDMGGKVLVSAPHEDGKADYSAEVGVLAASGAEDLVVFGYVDQGGTGIVQASLDTDAFSRFIFADGMVGDALVAVDGDIAGSFGTRPGSDSDGAAMFGEVASAAGIDPEGGPFRAESYDAAALIALAIQAAGSTDRSAIQAAIMDVANAPGEEIFPGELAKGLELLAEGKEVNYQGGSDVEFNEVGESQGSYKELEIQDGAFATVMAH